MHKVDTMRRKKFVIDSGLEPSPGLQVSFAVDWLSFTIKRTGGQNAFNFVAAFDDLSGRKEVHSMHGYNRAYRWQFGALMLWHDSKAQMGVHFILSGQALRVLHDAGFDGLWLIKRATSSFAKFTMIHLAMDMFNGSFTPYQMNEFMEKHEYAGRAQAGSFITTLNGGKTCYVGSWNSARFYRFYDKALEQSIDNLNWKRLELVLKSDYAQEFGYRFAGEETTNKAIEIFRGTVKTMANFNQGDWLKALEGTIEKLSLPQHKERKTREWLLTQVVPAMARYVFETGDESLLDDFAREFEATYEKVQNGL